MVELLEVTLLILCGPVDRLVWVEVAQTEKLSYIHSMYLCVIICTGKNVAVPILGNGLGNHRFPP